MNFNVDNFLALYITPSVSKELFKFVKFKKNIDIDILVIDASLSKKKLRSLCWNGGSTHLAKFYHNWWNAIFLLKVCPPLQISPASVTALRLWNNLACVIGCRFSSFRAGAAAAVLVVEDQ
jgi:hypothetical protein